MQELHSDSSGVTIERQDFYDRFSLETAGIGISSPYMPKKRSPHDPETCSDQSCPHPSHGLSTFGPGSDTNARAGDLTPDLGNEAVESRTYHPLNERCDVAFVGNVNEMVAGTAPRDAYLGDTTENLMRAAIQPDRRGGGSNGRKRSDGCSPDFGVLALKAMTERPRYA